MIDSTVHLVEATAGSATARRAWPSDWPVDAALPVEAYRAEMPAAGVDGGVLVTTVRAYGYDNAYAVDVAAADPGRFVSVGNVDVLAPGALDTLTRWVEERGMRGARFYGGDSTDAVEWLGDPRAAAAWRRAGELGIPVSAQRTRTETLPALASMLARFPEVPTVIYSMADPPIADGPPFAAAEPLLAMARYPQVHLNLSVHNLDAVARGPRPSAFLEVLADRFGSGRIMWGSYALFRGARARAGAPSLGGVVEQVRAAFGFLPPAELDMVLGGTAWSLYRPGGQSPPGAARPGRC